MRSLNWRNIGICVLVVVLLGFLSYVVIGTDSGEEKVCEEINVEIEESENIHFVSESEILKLIKKNYPKIIGSNKNDINTKKIEALLMKDPVIRKTECYFLPDGDLGVKVWQRHPVMRVFGDRNFYVDDEGKMFPLSDSYNAYVPIVTGKISIAFVTTQLKDFMVYIGKDEFWSAEIQQVDIANDNMLTIIPTVGDHKIEFGTLKNYEEKLQKLKKFYVEGMCKIGWGDYSTVNVEYNKQVICTRKEE